MYESNLRSWIKHLDFLIIDSISITISFWLAFFLRKNMEINELYWLSSYKGLFVVFLAFHFIIVFLFRTYSSVIRRGRIDELLSIIKHNAILMTGIMVYLVIVRQSEIFSRLFLAYFVAFNFVFMCITHLSWKQVIRRRLAKRDNQPRIVVISEKKLADDCVEKLNNLSYQAFKVSGVILLDGDEQSPASLADIPVVGNADDMMEYIRLNVVDQVVLYVEMVNDSINQLIQQLVDMGVVVHIDLAFFEQFPHKQLNRLGDLSVITTYFQTAGMMELFVKRVMDIAGAIVGLLITAVAFVFVAPIIYVKSPGPVLFSQYRIGKNGRKFKIYKFRSMYLDAEERKKELMEKNKMQGLMFKMDDDPRIIKGIGHLIRKTSIDELPQFWNILKGDMSLVGTRPPTVDEFEQYDYHHKIRLSFKPGLTGMWQVSGRSDITDFEEVVRLDEKYIREWSIALDIKIILRTIRVVLTRKGSE